MQHKAAVLLHALYNALKLAHRRKAHIAHTVYKGLRFPAFLRHKLPARIHHHLAARAEAVRRVEFHKLRIKSIARAVRRLHRHGVARFVIAAHRNQRLHGVRLHGTLQHTAHNNAACIRALQRAVKHNAHPHALSGAVAQGLHIVCRGEGVFLPARRADGRVVQRGLCHHAVYGAACIHRVNGLRLRSGHAVNIRPVFSLAVQAAAVYHLHSGARGKAAFGQKGAFAQLQHIFKARVRAEDKRTVCIVQHHAVGHRHARRHLALCGGAVRLGGLRPPAPC